MKDDSLRFEELRIERTPGFERTGFTLHDLSPGVNLVHGPNGSGKSTTARAIARLLWPASEGERVTLAGRFRLQGEEWEVGVDGSRVIHRRAGTEAPPPVLPPAQDQERYRLALHDLLQSRDAQFARAVVRESAGGYDLRSAAQVLEPKTAISRPKGLQDALEEAEAAYKEAVSAQGRTQAEEERLQELQRQWQEADEASRRVVVLEAALEHAAAREAEARARAELERYPEGFAKVAGNEYQLLCGIRERIARFTQEREEAAAAHAAALEALERNAVPEGLEGEEVVRGLEGDLGTLRDAERTVAEAARAAAAAERKLESEARGVGGLLAPEKLEEVDLSELAPLTAFAARAAKVQAERLALEASLRVLGEPATVAENVDRLEKGVRCLESWLRAPAPPSLGEADPRARQAGLAATLLLIVAGVGLAVVVTPWLLLLAAMGALLLAIVWRGDRQAPPVADERQIHRRDFDKLEVQGPAAWEPEKVEEALETLRKQVLAFHREAEREQRRVEYRAGLRRIEIDEAEIERQRQALADRFGVDPAAHPTQLVMLAESLNRWQAARTDLLAARETLRRAEAQRDEAAARLREKLQRLGYGELESAGEIAGAITAFDNRRRRLEDASAALTAAGHALARLDREQEEAGGEMQRIFAALGLDPDADETVKEWCARQKEYARARDEHHTRRAALEQAARRLAGRGGEEALSIRTLPELEGELAEQRARAAARDALAEQMAGIRKAVEIAKGSHDIELALDRISRAQEALRQAREKDVRGMIAAELVAYVEEATRDRLLPAVFHRAREIFARITRGRYELRLRREGDPEFVAFDTEDRRERALHELSSGSRVQLLIAVRVAFVEQQEHGVKLPLVLDEVLGNSDDERARAIMEAALQLAAEGRQIFYFTAQADEVARWRQLAGFAANGVEVREIDLAAIRGLQRAVEMPALPPAPKWSPPPPDGASQVEYGRRLAVPRLDRAEEPLSAVHLWYLTDDPETLHGLLRLGPDRWGSLEALVRNGGRPLVEDGVLQRLEIAARATESFLEAARVGVGLPVTRAVLQDSGAVSGRFLDRVAALAEQVRGDGVRLMEGIEGGSIRGFRADNKEKLREYLEENGYCPSEPPLEPHEIRVRVLGRIATELAAKRVAVEEVDRLLERLWIGLGGEQ